MRRLALLVAGLLLSALVPLARAETVQHANLRVSFSGKLTPTALPRVGTAPIAVTVGGEIATLDGAPPPQLQGIEIAINRAGRFDSKGLPSCTYADVQPSTTAAAQAACGPAKVGEGSFAANVVIPEQSPFPSEGKIVAFNGTIPCSAPRDARLPESAPQRHARTRSGGHAALVQDPRSAGRDRGLMTFASSRIADAAAVRPNAPPTTPEVNRTGRASACIRPVILAHVYGTVPVPLSYTLVLRMTPGKGTWGTVLNATLPEVTSDVAYITGISLTLGRRFAVAGKTHGYLSAGCPAPAGFPGATFPLARASFSFGAAGTLASTLNRSCRVKG
jgi:hypothetical protein